MDITIPTLPTEYTLDDCEVLTRDDQRVAYGIWRHGRYPTGCVVRNGTVWWVMEEDTRQEYINREWTGVVQFLQQHSETVARLKKYARGKQGEPK